jgi:hypothetical protein
MCRMWRSAVLQRARVLVVMCGSSHGAYQVTHVRLDTYITSQLEEALLTDV